MVVVVVGRRAFLPVVRIGFEILAPVQLFEIVQFFDFERRVTRLNLDAGRGLFLARPRFPIIIRIRTRAVAFGRQRFAVALGCIGIGLGGFGSRFGGTLVER